jgi:hypothetical protein
MTPADSKTLDLKARLNGLFAKVEEVRGFL